MRNSVIFLPFALLVTGCGTTGTDGVVSIGPDMYMIGRQGGLTDFSGSAVKARLYQEANNYCSEKNRDMVPLNSNGQDSAGGTYASAEIQFRCVPKN